MWAAGDYAPMSKPGHGTSKTFNQFFSSITHLASGVDGVHARETSMTLYKMQLMPECY